MLNNSGWFQLRKMLTIQAFVQCHIHKTNIDIASYATFQIQCNRQMLWRRVTCVRESLLLWRESIVIIMY